jgi:hypothetical protein
MLFIDVRHVCFDRILSAVDFFWQTPIRLLGTMSPINKNKTSGAFSTSEVLLPASASHHVKGIFSSENNAR